MKKNYALALLCMTLVFLFIYASCARGPADPDETNSVSVSTNAALESQTEQTANETEFDSMLVSLTPEGYMPYPVTTAVAEKDLKATDWMKSYLQKNKAAFDLITAEILEIQNYHWGVSNSGNGFVRNPAIPDPNWTMLSQDTRHSIEAIDADFRKEFGPDVSVSVACNGVPRDDGRRAVHFSCIILGDDWEELHRLLSYFPDGYANIRPDTPYVDFGDGWYFYSGINL